MNLPISFEFFPPKTPEGADKLRAVRQQLYARRR
jgi:methylenetetrahydrofolate reductase (NADPH)